MCHLFQNNYKYYNHNYINNELFSTHTHACEFMTSKTLWHKKNGIP